MSYLQGDLTNPETYRRLGEHLATPDKSAGAPGNHIYYLAIADRFFGTVVAGLGAAGLTAEKDGQWRRVVIEKPFGHDLASAKALNAEILKTMQESQIYRIDHFLGKETVQNIMALRFANGLFEPGWNRQHIDHIQITVAETVGVERRGKFYEKTGALRDMVPNHVLQLLAMTAMEPPNSFDADAVRAKKTEVIQAIRPLDPTRALQDAVRGQYDEGVVKGSPVRAYRHEPDVAPEFGDRDLHRVQVRDRQLALGRHALLSANRQVHGAPIYRDRGPLPSGAVCALPRHRRREDEPQLDGPSHPAGRRRQRSSSPPNGRARQSGSRTSAWISLTRPISRPRRTRVTRR